MTLRGLIFAAGVSLAGIAGAVEADSPREQPVPAAHPGRLMQELGDGLLYARVNRAPADLPATGQFSGHAIILDLRFATDDGTAEAPLGALIRATAGAKRPVFLLVNAGTSDRLIRAVNALDVLPGVITISPSSAPFASDFQVVTSADEERRAFEAFTSGKSVIELTTDLPEKRRNDEASLTQHPALDDSIEDEGAAAPARPAAKPPPRDAVLQRAVHLYRGLRALKVV